MHPEHLQEGPIYSCYYCYHDFETMDALGEHLVEVHVTRRYAVSQPKFRKNRRYRQTRARGGRCPHCGVKCAPYYECDERRAYKRENYRKNSNPVVRGRYRMKSGKERPHHKWVTGPESQVAE